MLHGKMASPKGGVGSRAPYARKNGESQRRGCSQRVTISPAWLGDEDDGTRIRTEHVLWQLRRLSTAGSANQQGGNGWSERLIDFL